MLSNNKASCYYTRVLFYYINIPLHDRHAPGHDGGLKKVTKKKTNRTETNGSVAATLNLTDYKYIGVKGTLASHTLSPDLRILNGACILLLV